MTNKIFRSFFAVVAMLGTALGFVSCEMGLGNEGENGNQGGSENPTMAVSTSSLNFSNVEGSQNLDITCDSNWKSEVVAADWVTVTPATGKGNKTVTVSVAENTTGAVREAEVKFIALHSKYGTWDTKTVKVMQSADEKPTVTEEFLYGDNFDGAVAEKTYGSGSSWPYIDQFPEFANPEGPASENVTYSGTGVSVRANSTSSSDYSDYDGSGSNNIFFGGSAYFQINDIALDAAQKSYKLTFGTEKYTQDGDSTFKNSEFHVSISRDGIAWAEIEYTYAGTEPGRWNVATANFTLTTVPENLYIKFAADVASVYRIDDVKLFIGNGGQEIDFDNIKEPEPPTPPTTDALYFENFDGQAAVKGEYWPYVADFPEMKNAVGPAATNVSYEGYNATVRNNSNSNGSYSDYAGSGVNNIFFGNTAWFMIKDLALESSQSNLVLTFGTEKYSQDNGKVFTNSEFIVSLSADGQKWTSIDYTFAGTAEGRWNVATANFTLTEVPAALYIKFEALVASSYRIDDVTLDLGDGGQQIDLSAGSVTPDPEPDPTPGEVVKATVAEFLNAAEDNTVYELTGTIANAVAGKEYYGNFDIVDTTGSVYIYGLVDENNSFGIFQNLGLKNGDTITIRTVRTSYNGQPQGKNALYVSHVPGEGGETPEPEPGVVVKATVAEFLAAAEGNTIYELTGVITNVANTQYGNFDLKDETGTVYVYGIKNDAGEYAFTSLGLKEGDTLTIQGVRTSYNDMPQMGNGVYVSHVAGAEIEQPENEATLSFSDAANRTVFTTSQQVWEQNGIKLINDKASSTSNVADYVAPVRFYKSSSITVETEKSITQIKFACNNTSYATALQGSITTGTVTVDGSIVTVVLPNAATSFSVAQLGAQVRMNSLTVTFAE